VNLSIKPPSPCAFFGHMVSLQGDSPRRQFLYPKLERQVLSPFRYFPSPARKCFFMPSFWLEERHRTVRSLVDNLWRLPFRVLFLVVRRFLSPFPSSEFLLLFFPHFPENDDFPFLFYSALNVSGAGASSQRPSRRRRLEAPPRHPFFSSPPTLPRPRPSFAIELFYRTSFVARGI